MLRLKEIFKDGCRSFAIRLWNTVRVRAMLLLCQKLPKENEKRDA
jgi:hypothetical protein